MQTAQDITDPRFRGDLFSDDPRFAKYCIECKVTGETLTLERVLSMDGEIRKWWKQASEESGDKVPILIFKYFGSPIFVACWEAYLTDNCNRIIIPIGDYAVCITTIENLNLGV